jgi:hypothetical protein
MVPIPNRRDIIYAAHAGLMMQHLVVPFATHNRPTATTASSPSSTRRGLLPFPLIMIIQGIAVLLSSLNDASPVAEAHAEKYVRPGEESLFQRDNDELRPVELCAEERADVLRVREVQCCVDLVQAGCTSARSRITTAPRSAIAR